MSNNDLGNLIRLMKKLSEIFDNGREISQLKAGIYFDILGKYPIEKIESAVNVVLATRIYSGLPKPAEILEIIEKSYNYYDREMAAGRMV